MNQSNVVTDFSGTSYYIKTPRDGIKNRVASIPFVDIGSAKRFLKRFAVNDSFWKKVASECDLAVNVLSDNEELLVHISKLVVTGKVSVIRLNVNRAASDTIQKRTFKISERESYMFSDASETLRRTSSTLSFNSRQKAEEFIASLSLNDIQLKETLNALNLEKTGVKTSASAQDILAEALVEGRAAVFLNRKAAPIASKPAESPTEVPGNRPVDLAPISPQAEQQKPAKQSIKSDKDQAETLVEAAEAGAAFCEDCEAQK